MAYTNLSEQTASLRAARKRIKELETENKALRISEQDSNLKAKEYFSESANAKQALAIARETIQSQSEQIKELGAELTRLRNIINAKRR